MGDAGFVIGVLIILLACLVVLLASVMARLRAVSRELNDLSKQITKLDQKVDQQAERLSKLQGLVDARAADPMQEFGEILRQWRSKGMIPALSLLGTKLFRAYLGKRRAKALPAKVETEVSK